MTSQYQKYRILLAIALGVVTGLLLWWVFTPTHDIESLNSLHRDTPSAISVAPPRLPETAPLTLPDAPPAPQLPKDAPPQLEALIARYQEITKSPPNQQEQAQPHLQETPLDHDLTTAETTEQAAKTAEQTAPAVSTKDSETQLDKLQNELIAYSQGSLSSPPQLSEIAEIITKIDGKLSSQGRTSVLDFQKLAEILRTSERMIKLNTLIQSEATKGEQADIEQLRQYSSELKTLAPQLNQPLLNLSSLEAPSNE